MGWFSAEIATDHYTDSESYWRHEQDFSCDGVRQMSALCDVEPVQGADRTIYDFCHKPSAPARIAYPNHFITIAPAEWLFPMPAWLQDLTANNLSDVSGLVALHIYHVLMTTMKTILVEGVWFSSVFHCFLVVPGCCSCDSYRLAVPCLKFGPVQQP